MDFARKVKRRYRDGLILNSIYSMLKRRIFSMDLFYLFQEGLSGEAELVIQPEIQPIVVRPLKPSDLRTISTKEERGYSAEEMLQMLSDGCGCMGIEYGDQIVAWAWYNLRNCEDEILSFSFKLKENEAYLYGQTTLKTYRGNSLAPFLKYRIYMHLSELGRTKLFAIVDFSNIPSIKFRKKLDAKPIKLFMNISFLDRFHRNILLRKYRS
jgi:hypothetical protein